MVVSDTKVPLFKDYFWHFQIKIKFRKKITSQSSIRLPNADFFWIIHWLTNFNLVACNYRTFGWCEMFNSYVKFSFKILPWEWLFYQSKDGLKWFISEIWINSNSLFYNVSNDVYIYLLMFFELVFPYITWPRYCNCNNER